MRLFLWPLVFTIVFLVGFSEIAAPVVQGPIYTLPIHKTLYLERGIYDEEMYYILQAALEWSEATNGQVIFDIKRLPQPHIETADSVIIVNVTPDYPNIILLDNYNRYTTQGYFNDANGLAYIALVDDRLDDGNYAQVVMHELGHALGLAHIEGGAGIDTLMCPSTNLGSRHITDADLAQLCKLYHCDSRQFHGFSEIQ